MDERVEKYISKFPEDTQKKLKKLRRAIMDSAPDAEETMSYGVPAFKQSGNLVCYAAFKNHVGFYPEPSGIEKFRKELSDYETAEGTVKFPHDKPIPYELVRRIVEFRVGENLKKKD
jgi:uncharacterized protein YdhG (YjbR/CyaY superfamily)